MASLDWITEAEWNKVAHIRGTDHSEVNVYQREGELLVISWCMGRWTATYSNVAESVMQHARKRGDALDALREEFPGIARLVTAG